MKWVGLLMLGLVGCASWSEADTMDAALQAVRGACVAAEWRIVERENSSPEQDTEELARVRKACDGALQMLEAVK